MVQIFCILLFVYELCIFRIVPVIYLTFNVTRNLYKLVCKFFLAILIRELQY